MADLTDNNPITANGDYDLNLRPGRWWALSASSNFSGGTITVKYENASAGFTTYTDSDDNNITFAADGGEFCFVPSPGKVRFSLAASTSPSINIGYTEEVGG